MVAPPIVYNLAPPPPAKYLEPDIRDIVREAAEIIQHGVWVQKPCPFPGCYDVITAVTKAILRRSTPYADFILLKRHCIAFIDSFLPPFPGAVTNEHGERIEPYVGMRTIYWNDRIATSKDAVVSTLLSIGKGRYDE